MTGSRREREAQPSSETVHHIVKAEVHAEVSALKAEVNALDTKMEALVKAEVSALKAEVSALGGKLDTLISMMERQAGPP